MRSFIRIGLVFALLALALAAYSFNDYKNFTLAQDKTIIVAHGAGTRAALRQLHDAAILPPPWEMALPLFMSGKAHALKAGEYQFTAGMSAAQILDHMARGMVVVHKITVPEGWTVAQVRAALAAEILLSGDVPQALAEGSVFPDTEFFIRGEARAAVLTRMQNKMTAVINELWPQRADNLPFKMPGEALALASVVEKETGVDAERAHVASVFINRLRKGMKLESDPTVAYGIELVHGPLTHALTGEDLHYASPYNSYLHEGLPPTPICNPGKAAILAVLHPMQTDDLYFVATGTGGHNFASTLTAHDKNVSAYRAVMKAQQVKK